MSEPVTPNVHFPICPHHAEREQAQQPARQANARRAGDCHLQRRDSDRLERRVERLEERVQPK